MPALRKCTPDFRQLMMLTASGATGKRVKAEVHDWNAVIRFANEQAVLPLMACGLLVNPQILCPEELRTWLLDMMREQSGSNLLRRQRIFHLIHELEEVGLDVNLIKGYSVGASYFYPECRGATDTDLFVPPSQEKAVCAFLLEKGFRVDSRLLTSHHSVCQHPRLGMVEVHIQLYDEIVRESWFKNAKTECFIKESSIRMFCDGTQYSTLGYTDNLIFLTLHMVKHFIDSGMGLRMMMDVAVFFSVHHERIDFERYWRIMDRLQYAGMVSAVLWAMIDTGCFQKDDFPGLRQKKQENIDVILYDLEVGGIMGTKQGHEKRFDGYYEYSRQVLLREKSLFQYCLYMLGYKIRSAKTQMLPSEEQLRKLYPILDKRKWLTPVMRVYRIFDYPVRKICSGVLREQIRFKDIEMPEDAKRRIEMFKILKML